MEKNALTVLKVDLQAQMTAISKISILVEERSLQLGG